MTRDQLETAFALALIDSGLSDRTPGRSAEINGKLMVRLLDIAERYRTGDRPPVGQIIREH